jgi:hypothetical protein
MQGGKGRKKSRVRSISGTRDWWVSFSLLKERKRQEREQAGKVSQVCGKRTILGKANSWSNLEQKRDMITPYFKKGHSDFSFQSTVQEINSKSAGSYWRFSPIIQTTGLGQTSSNLVVK